MFALKPFQEDAVARLKKEFLALWKSSHQNIPLVFKSPTGSGKTIMLAQFLRDIVSDPRFQGQDVAFIWLTFSEDSYEQSKGKLEEYYGGASEIELLDLNDLNRGKLESNSVFFINWQKLKGTSKDSRKLRRDNEKGLTFDNFIAATHEDDRRIVVVIDEEHIGSDTNLALELVDGIIKPKISIRLSATPKYEPTREETDDLKAGFVRVKREDVIKAGLIKEKIVFQTQEDLTNKTFKGKDQDEILLELAYGKRLELIKLYEELEQNINPLVLIQLPNDDQAVSETNLTNKQQIVLNYLAEKDVDPEQVAVWLSQEKVNLEDVEKNNSPVSFLLFKQAAATGWDCPRASVLVMFREIKNPTFAIQTVGRILRMPLGVHFTKPELNIGYLYTNYKRNEVLTEFDKNKSENRPAIYTSTRKNDVVPIKVESVFMSRTDYNDLGDTFQDTFAKTADKYFGITDKDLRAAMIAKIKAKDLELEPRITNGLVVGVEIDNFDNFAKELGTEGDTFEQEMSQYDVERLYNLICFNFISHQDDENKKFAPERSWGKLKTALNVWLTNRLGEPRGSIYRIALNDLLSPTSKLGPIIGDALDTYRPIREQEVNKKNARAKRIETIELPRETIFFTDLYEEMKVKKCAMSPFYFEKNYTGEDNEKEFIKFLESHNSVVWWYKNGDLGSEHFSIPYFNPDDNKESLFFPDWIVRTKSTTWIIDTKKGATAEAAATKFKADALQEWLKTKKGFAGGIAVQDGPNGWKLSNTSPYSYKRSLEGWKKLTDLMK
jgi:type III restriction enzyme